MTKSLPLTTTTTTEIPLNFDDFQNIPKKKSKKSNRKHKLKFVVPSTIAESIIPEYESFNSDAADAADVPDDDDQIITTTTISNENDYDIDLNQSKDDYLDFIYSSKSKYDTDDENLENVKKKLEVTRVNGRYMSVDSDQLLKYEKDIKKSKENNNNNDKAKKKKLEMIFYTNQDKPIKIHNTFGGGGLGGIDRKDHGACFTGTDSYLHFSDAETMRRIISYQIDLNLRFKTRSNHGLILWSGRHSALEDDDFLSLGIEKGFLHLRYNLGSGEVNIQYNSTKVSDGLWHRVRATRLVIDTNDFD